MSPGRRPARVVGVLAAVLLLAGLVVVAAPSAPVVASDAATLAFLRSTDGGFSRTVHVTSSTGSQERRLSGQQAEGRLAFSPDGRQVLFSGPPGNDDTFGRRALFVVDIDTQETRQLTDPRYADTDPDWSPAGGRFAFVRATNGNFNSPSCCTLVVSDAAGGGATAVPGTTGADDPAWSPDGTRVAYTTAAGLFTVLPDGSDRRQLAAGGFSAPSWAPDGSHLAAVQDEGLGQSRAMVMTATGSAFSFPDDLDGVTEDPRFTADGRSLVFVRGSGAGVQGRFRGELYRVPAFDGGGSTQLFTPASVPHHLALAPPHQPVGEIDVVALADEGVRVRAWGFDPAAPEERTSLVINVNGRETVLVADEPRPDVAARHPEAGGEHGLDAVVPTSRPGPFVVCVAVRTVDGARTAPLGCAVVSTRRVRAAPGGD